MFHNRTMKTRTEIQGAVAKDNRFKSFGTSGNNFKEHWTVNEEKVSR